MGKIIDDTSVILSVLSAVRGYPGMINSEERLGFDKDLTRTLFDKIVDDENYSPTDSDKKVILKSFEVFLETIDDHDCVSLTDRSKEEVVKLHHKLADEYNA